MWWLALILFSVNSSCAQNMMRAANAQLSVSPTFPREIRGYKVERAQPKIKRAGNEGATGASSPGANTNDLLQLGEPRVASVTPFELTIEVSVTIAPVEQRGQVDFLLFEDVRVAETPVTVDDYNHSFKMPNERALTLPHPAIIRISTPRLALGAVNQITGAQDELPVTGRLWVCGRFKKFLATFKRAVPVEIDLRIANPLKRKQNFSTD